MRIHVLTVPHSQTHSDFSADAFQMKVWKFLKMMTGRGHEIFHYGHARRDWDYPDVEAITVIDDATIRSAYGDDYVDQQSWRDRGFSHYYDCNDLVHRTYCDNSTREIIKRCQPHDIVLHFWGMGTQPVAAATPDLIHIEPGIGNGSGFARWRIYESNAVRSAVEGADSVNYCRQDWYHRVIPNYFDPEDFEYSHDKQDYVLYLGRIGYNKGVDIAVEATAAAGKTLKIAGQGSLLDLGYTRTPDHVEILGYADKNTRKYLLSNASSLFIASRYAEPFGGVQVEAWLSGTPVISPDWGCFPEMNRHGETGYRCRMFRDFVAAINDCSNGKISSAVCRSHGLNYTLDKIAPEYEQYFQDVLNVYTAQGWYTP